GDRLADALGRGDIAAVFQVRAAGLGVAAADVRQRLAGVIVDQLGVNVLAAAEDAQPRTLGRAEESLAHAVLTTQQTLGLFLVFVSHFSSTSHHFAPAPAKALPGLILTTSPS